MPELQWASAGAKYGHLVWTDAGHLCWVCECEEVGWGCVCMGAQNDVVVSILGDCQQYAGTYTFDSYSDDYADGAMCSWLWILYDESEPPEVVSAFQLVYWPDEDLWTAELGPIVPWTWNRDDFTGGVSVACDEETGLLSGTAVATSHAGSGCEGDEATVVIP